MQWSKVGCLAGMSLLLAGVQTAEAQKCRNCRDARIVEIRRASPSSSPLGALEFGVRGGYDFDQDVPSAGAQLRIPIFRPLYLVPSGDVFFDDSATEWQLNADLLIRPVGLAGLYGGAGAAFVNSQLFDADAANDDDETEVGLNVVVGLDGGRIWYTTVRPFVEARWTTVEDIQPFRLVAGINVPVSGFRH